MHNLDLALGMALFLALVYVWARIEDGYRARRLRRDFYRDHPRHTVGRRR